jgi:hypothetical protein
MRRVAIVLCCFLFPVASPAAPPLVERIQEKTGLPLTLTQKEELVSFSRKKHVVLKDAAEMLIRQLSQILSLPEKFLDEELFSETTVPRANLDPVTGAKLEKLLGREMTKTEYELVNMAFEEFEGKEDSAYSAYAGEVANLVDLPQDDVRELVSR